MEKEQSQQSWPLGSHTAPWMVFTCANHTEKSQAVFSISERRLYSTSVDEMKNKFLRTPQDWFLLLGNLSSGTSLWNPITSEKVELPPMEHDPTMIRCICVTSEAPTSPNCVVVFADLKNSLLCFCHPGDEKWVSQKYDLDEDEECLESIAAVEGKLYLIVRTKPEVFRFSSSLSDKLVLIEFSSYPRFTALPLEEPLIWRSGLRRRKCYLVESCGELFLLTLYSPFDAAPGIRAMLDVYKMDFAKRAWAKAYNLGDRVFFMDVFSFAASRSPSELGVNKNCIYFLFTEQSYFYIYDAEKRSLSSHETCPELRAACSTPFWCLPDSS